MTIHEILKQKFRIDDALAQLILTNGRVKTLSKGSFLYYQDDDAKYIALPIQGVLGFHSRCEDGVGNYYNVITPGTILNEEQLLLGGNAITEVKVATECQVVIMSFETANLLFDLDVGFSKLISQSLARKQRLLQGLFLLRSEKEISVKVEQALELISPLVEDNYVPLNIQSLASLLGVSRNSVGRVIKQLIDGGKVEKQGSGFNLIPTRSQYCIS
ncbi:hypothetical protein JCM19241_1005 [Vibrio ishigakensis]|uniref:Cyclic nucleotide-binding domain-containing protein n=1 Tax=Vibrio ishigakensis TaxID=1481914 RepID=A0A0B8QCI5_9VIBR|nr:hypothetical protein JCM19241_1005 [Vibrio ishigakensis]